MPALPQLPDYPPSPAEGEEWDLNSCPPGRFDEPAPLQLETGGITEGSHTPELTPRASALQVEFWSAHTSHKNSIAAKLRIAGRLDLAEKLEHCHSEYTITVCKDCGRVGRFPNRCDCFFCPECQPRLSNNRKDAIGWWAARCPQPKHVVLTVRNQPIITKEHIDELKHWWKLLRNRRFADNWVGGFYSIEVTNEGRGWHLHIHALIDAVWIDASELARQWDSVTNHNGHIVKVKDARGKEYLEEVTKYVIKGSQMAKWKPEDIRSCIEALDGVRTFGVFGELYGARTEFAEWLKEIREHKPLCECGSCNIRYYSEPDYNIFIARLTPNELARPPKLSHLQMDLLDMHVQPQQVGA